MAKWFCGTALPGATAGRGPARVRSRSPDGPAHCPGIGAAAASGRVATSTSRRPSQAGIGTDRGGAQRVAGAPVTGMPVTAVERHVPGAWPSNGGFGITCSGRPWMRRRVNAWQVEVFKAVIEHGTVSVAAAALSVSQPAISKSVAQLKADCELQVFDRIKGRLAPTGQGMRLYAEIDRIFGGMQQVENAIDALHRQAQGRLLIGVMLGLSGAFVQRVAGGFLQAHPGTYRYVEARNSDWIMESLVGRRLDVGVLSARMRTPFVESETLGKTPSSASCPKATRSPPGGSSSPPTSPTFRSCRSDPRPTSDTR
ncbi:MAG: LysR family transcriptional regulator [Janthinobacterium lividum]